MWTTTSTFAKFLESESHIVFMSTLTCVWQSNISDTCLVFLWQRHLFIDVFTWTIQLQCQRAEMDRPRTPSRCSCCVWIWCSSKLRNVWLGNIQPVIVPLPRNKIRLIACSNRHSQCFWCEFLQILCLLHMHNMCMCNTMNTLSDNANMQRPYLSYRFFCLHAT
jgi:hypothetical protein